LRLLPPAAAAPGAAPRFDLGVAGVVEALVFVVASAGLAYQTTACKPARLIFQPSASWRTAAGVGNSHGENR